jgi:hypothetical protein
MSTHQITRYQLPRFRRPKPNTTGDWVRYCDYVQDMENADRRYQRALITVTAAMLLSSIVTVFVLK